MTVTLEETRETQAFVDQMVGQELERFSRVYEADLAEGDGRTLDLRIVPYNVVATVSDPPDHVPYREMFLPGAFEGQMRAANRIWLNFEHEQGLRGIIGTGSELRDHEDGLHGTFRVGTDSDAEKALQYVHEGVLRGVSLEFRARKSQTVDGVRQRVRAIVDKVSLCRFPAYQDAQVVAVRTEPAALAPVLLDPAVDELLARVGWEPLLCRAVTSRPWNGSPARFTDQQYLASCLIVRPGAGPAKERGSLPVLEPNGDLNTNALGAAAAVLSGARGGVRNVTAAQKQAAARKLVRYYGQAKMEPPASLRATAGAAPDQPMRPVAAKARMDAEDLNTVAQMIELGTEYLADQDETDDAANVPKMKSVLEILSGLVPVEAAENEPAEPEDEE